jgi:arylsulfatase A-like enzyme
MKKIAILFSAAVVSGFVFGLARSLHSVIIPNRYFRLKMYRILSLDLLSSLNQWIIIALALAVIVLFIGLALRILSGLLLRDVVQLTIKDGPRLIAVLASFAAGAAFFILGGWAINHYWLPYRFHILSLLADMVILGLALLVGWGMSKIGWERIFRRLGRSLGISSIIAAALWVGLNLGVFFGYKRPASKIQNIVLISVDTLRADHLGCYGYGKNTSPHIDAMTQDCVVFRNCCVPEDHTLPSHMSLLTSLYPPTHGVKEGISLAPSVVTLAESLRNAGYRTAGFVRDCIWMNAEYGFDQGFEKYIVRDYSLGRPELNAQFQNRMVQEYLRKHKNRSNFIFVHYYDVHSDYRRLPYESPEPYEKMFYPDYHGDFRGGFRDVLATNYLVYVNSRHVKLKDDDVKYVISLYDGGVAYVDECIGGLIRSIKDLGLYENSLIILTSDHGEEFGEHGAFLHGGNLLYDQTTHVPLIIKLPGPGGQRREITELVESTDVMPFVLDYLGIKDRPKMQGASFLPLLRGSGGGKDYAFGFAMDKARAFIKNNVWKLIADYGQEDVYKLFNVIEDPQENHDVRDDYPEVSEELKTKLKIQFDRLWSNEKRGQPVIMTPKQIETLKSLGYVSK